MRCVFVCVCLENKYDTTHCTHTVSQQSVSLSHTNTVMCCDDVRGCEVSETKRFSQKITTSQKTPPRLSVCVCVCVCVSCGV